MRTAIRNLGNELSKRIVIVGLLLAPVVDARELLVKTEIEQAAQRKAVCNDGSPGVFYFQPGSGKGRKLWVVLLEGGFFCYLSGCSGRNRTLMTSLDKPFTRDYRDGILSSDRTQNPDFYNANKVAIIYCSSDLWSGNRFDAGGGRAIEFRGRNIFRAVIEDLRKRSAPNLTEPGIEILLAGQSAGGSGVMLHVDWLAQQLPNAKVRGFNDAGWWPEQSAVINSGFKASIAKGILLWKGRPDPKCARANKTAKSKCYLSTAFDYLSTPVFIHQPQWDSIFVAPSDSNAAGFAKAVRDSLAPVPAAFSPLKPVHTLSDRKSFSTLRVKGLSLKDALGNWFFERAGKVKVIQK